MHCNRLKPKFLTRQTANTRLSVPLRKREKIKTNSKKNVYIRTSVPENINTETQNTHTEIQNTHKDLN